MKLKGFSLPLFVLAGFGILGYVSGVWLQPQDVGYRPSVLLYGTITSIDHEKNILTIARYPTYGKGEAEVLASLQIESRLYPPQSVGRFERGDEVRASLKQTDSGFVVIEMYPYSP